jgi:hypothetical protein
VDAGTGCFANPASLAVASAVLAEDGGMLEDPLSTALLGSERHAVVVSPGPGAEPVAIFETGWGDGLYPTWFGLDASGQVTVVITDFLLAQHPDELAPGAEAEAPAPAGKAGGLLARLRRRA